MVEQPKVNLPNTLTKIEKHWSPRLVANLNSAYDIKVAKIKGDFVWHSHPDTDELFYVLSGSLTIEMDKSFKDVSLSTGDMYVVPRAVRHRPISSSGAEIMLIEKAGTINTGDAAEEHPEMTNTVKDARGEIAQ